jgi:hypothetical protein
MPTSGVYDWPLTAEEVVTQALVEIGAYAAGETPSGTDMDDAIVRLNAMLKSVGGEANLFHDKVDTVTVTGGDSSVAAPDDAHSINSVRYVQSATNHRLMGQWNRDQYYMLPNRAQTSSSGPSIWYAQKTTTGITIYVWPVTSTDIDLELDYNATVQTVTDPSETIDVPQEWQEFLILGLASRCASMFGTTRVDPATVQRVDGRASALYQRLLDRDRPDSYYFEPDC